MLCLQLRLRLIKKHVTVKRAGPTVVLIRNNVVPVLQSVSFATYVNTSFSIDWPQIHWHETHQWVMSECTAGCNNRWAHQACRNSMHRSHSHIASCHGHIVVACAAQHRLLPSTGCGRRNGALVHPETQVLVHSGPPRNCRQHHGLLSSYPHSLCTGRMWQWGATCGRASERG